MELCALFWEYYLKCSGEDLSSLVTLTVAGNPIEITKAEAEICSLKYEHIEAQGVFCGEELIGFALYHRIADCILYVRHMYIRHEYEGHGVAIGLFKSMGKPIRKFIFKTRNDIPPLRFLSYRGKKKGENVIQWKDLYKSDLSTVWEMEWVD